MAWALRRQTHGKPVRNSGILAGHQLHYAVEKHGEGPSLSMTTAISIVAVAQLGYMDLEITWIKELIPMEAQRRGSWMY